MANQRFHQNAGYRVASILFCCGAAILDSHAAFGDQQTGESTAAPATAAQLDEIVVTAQKREQSINDVGMSITALSGERLKELGITSAQDFGAISPGFVYSQTPQAGIPVYTLRGVGFYDTSLASNSTVSFYVDEVPLPYPVMTRGASLDLERVEILKGPQGTLFGQNSTGGAINEIAAKPLDHFAAGTDISYGSYDRATIEGFVTGPISDTLKVRVAFGTDQSGEGWQKSYTTGATVGKINKYEGRVLVDWDPNDVLSVRLAIDGWHDGSDSQVAQLVAVTPQNPAALPADIAGYPLPPRNNTAADWYQAVPLAQDDSFYQGSLRIDYKLLPDITLTSISAYDRYSGRGWYSPTGVNRDNLDWFTDGSIDAASQELRLAGTEEKFNWIVGANYERDTVEDNQNVSIADTSTDHALGLFLDQANTLANTQASTTAVFGNVDYRVLDTVSVHAGARFTKADRAGQECGYNGGNGNVGVAFGELSSLFKYGAILSPLPNPVGPHGCYTLGPDLTPSLTKGTLDETNVSYRTGVDWKVLPDTLLYVSASRGYKNGGFPSLAASSYSEYNPVVQERLDAYEAGVKSTLFNRTLQLNAAAFYYNYANKQFIGKFVDPTFGVLSALVNVPKSHLSGAELQATVRPISALHLTAAVTYLDTVIDRYTGFSDTGVNSNFSGTPFPYAPKWEATLDGTYEFALSQRFNGFLGALVNHHSATNAGLGNDPLLTIVSFTTLDVRAGIRNSDDSWSLSVWGRNVTNEFYTTAAQREQDTTVRFTGMPVTYGVTLSTHFK